MTKNYMSLKVSTENAFLGLTVELHGQDQELNMVSHSLVLTCDIL
jgi:hypothetical protein